MGNTFSNLTIAWGTPDPIGICVHVLRTQKPTENPDTQNPKVPREYPRSKRNLTKISRILGNFAIRSKNQVFSNLLVILRQGVVGLGTTAGALRQRVVVLGTTAGALRQRVVVVGTRFLWGFMFFDRFSIGKYISPPPLFLSWRIAKTLCFLPVQIAP